MARPTQITERTYEAIIFDRELLGRTKYRQYAADRPTHPVVRMLMARGVELWRVEFKARGRVHLLHVGLPGKVSTASRHVSRAELPEWMQHRIAALDVFGENFPTDYVDGVGRRLNKEVYYVEE